MSLTARTLLIAVASLLAGSDAIHASCVGPRSFSSNFQYLLVDGYPTAYYPYSLYGQFWALGSGAPQPGIGNDSGVASLYSWTPIYGHVDGDWNRPQVDGCIDAAGAGPALDGDECMVLVYAHFLYDPSILLFDGRTFFLVATALADPTGDPLFDFSQVEPPGLNQVQIPVPEILAIEAGAGQARVEARVEIPAAGLYLASGCADGVVEGYRLYAMPVPAGSGPPAAFNLEQHGWIPISATTASGAVAEATLSCGGTQDHYLSASLDLDSGFTLPLVSLASSVRIDTATDTDDDATPDACDPCTDFDGDGLGDPFVIGNVCPADNCPLDSNPAQADADGDGIGDACDRCFELTDPEPIALSPAGQQVAADFRASATRPVGLYRAATAAGPTELFGVSLFGGAALRLSEPLVAGGNVAEFELTPDGTTVIYRADRDVDGRFELFAVSVDGGEVTRLLATAPGDANVTRYRIAPDGARVVFVATLGFEPPHLYGIPVGGGAPERLNPALVSGGSVLNDFALTSDGSTVAYRAEQDTAGTAELYAVPIVGGAAIKLNQTVTSSLGEVRAFAVSPDGSRAVYRADAEANNHFELFSVPLDRSTEPVELNGLLATGGGQVEQGDVFEFAVTPDSSRVVYVAREDNFAREVYSVPIDGGDSRKLSGPFNFTTFNCVSCQGVIRFEITPDGSRVVYRADQRQDEWYELFSANVEGGAPAARLSGALQTGAGDVTGFAIPPDGSAVVYRADEDRDERFELYRVPVGGGARTRLNGPLIPGGGVTAGGFGFGAGGALTFYLADQQTPGTIELYSVPTAGGQSLRLGAAPAGASPLTVRTTPDGVRALFVAERLYAVPLDCVCNGDADADLLCGFDDNCPGAPNPDQIDTDADGVGDACDDCTDTDRDGFGDPGFDAACPVDNCPLVPNDQDDADADAVGDRCDTCTDRDGDAAGDPGFAASLCTVDNCPALANPDQIDTDGDGAGDACDCAPRDAAVRAPGPVRGVIAESLGAGGLRLRWPAPSGADRFAVTRVGLAALTEGDYGPCMAPALSGTSFDDATLPAAGAGWGYLIRGTSRTCGAGSLGTTHEDGERRNDNPAACP